ncbi:hypothetical protein TNCV_854911 [Trichonephila clavipes]|nr:hypothetical protein TNCV_854911 [Trichonephila clavipes]
MRCAGCSVTETAIYLGRARSTVSAVMTACMKCGNTDYLTSTSAHVPQCLRRLNGFQMLNYDEIVTSVQAESDPVDDETNEDKDNNNESS